MSDDPENGSDTSGASKAARIFLVVVDESEELTVALRYACYRARACNGRVAILYVMEPQEFLHWMAVENLMREEQRIEAEQKVQRYAKEVYKITGVVAIIHLREGKRRDELLELIAEDPSISVLVLGAGTGPDGPGPLISYLVGRGLHHLRIPLTIVPGTLTDEQLKAITA